VEGAADASKAGGYAVKQTAEFSKNKKTRSRHILERPISSGPVQWRISCNRRRADIGANDVVNPAAEDDLKNPTFVMKIQDAGPSKNGHRQ
jgi:hypothetical protein